MDRLETLKSLLAQNPQDSFLRYGLAMEYARLNRLEESAEEFLTLLNSNPDYRPGYYQAAQTLEKLGRVDEARQMYQKGMEVAARQGDAHTRSELQTALDLLD